MGLAISNDIVREHGGTIHVTSAPGEFTNMQIELPLVRPTVSLEEDTGGDVEQFDEVEDMEEAEEVEPVET